MILVDNEKLYSHLNSDNQKACYNRPSKNKLQINRKERTSEKHYKKRFFLPDKG